MNIRILKIVIAHIFFTFITVSLINARSVQRPLDTTIPGITTSWSDGSGKSYELINSHYESFPIFKLCKKKNITKYRLPKKAIPYRMAPEKAVTGRKLDQLIQHLLTEIDKKKRHYKHFHVITRKNFNRGKKCGLMILKFRNYPFVLKLFIERPDTFINSHCKGLDNVWFFPMGGGVNRHITGLTRVANAREIRKKLDEHPSWGKAIDIPRKWFWLPEKTPWMTIKGKNIGTTDTIETVIPGTYGVIADAINIDKSFNLFSSKKYSATTMDICNYLENRLDPHIDNFVIEKKSRKMVIVDTEHFTTVVGLRKKTHFRSYFDWYRHLIQKCGKDWLFRTKKERKIVQRRDNPFAEEQLGITND